MKETIGTNAGIVWQALEGKGFKALKEVKKETKLTEKNLYAALGWLAREDKIEFKETSTDLFIAVH